VLLRNYAWDHLWPQLEEILREYVFGGETPLGSLLFPSPRLDPEGMVVDVRKALDRIAGRAGWDSGDIRTKMFRHTYCAARLQSLDRGAPVSEYTVSRELGHGWSIAGQEGLRTPGAGEAPIRSGRVLGRRLR